MTAVEDMRAMADRIIAFVAGRGDQWQTPGAPDYLLIEAATLLTGVANSLEHVGVDLSRDTETR